MDDRTLNRLEGAVDRLLQRVGALREENHRLSADRDRLADELSRLRGELAAGRAEHVDLLKLRKENEVYRRKTRFVRDQVERMLSRFQSLEE